MDTCDACCARAWEERKGRKQSVDAIFDEPACFASTHTCANSVVAVWPVPALCYPVLGTTGKQYQKPAGRGQTGRVVTPCAKILLSTINPSLVQQLPYYISRYIKQVRSGLAGRIIQPALPTYPFCPRLPLVNQGHIRNEIMARFSSCFVVVRFKLQACKILVCSQRAFCAIFRLSQSRPPFIMETNQTFKCF